MRKQRKFTLLFFVSLFFVFGFSTVWAGEMAEQPQAADTAGSKSNTGSAYTAQKCGDWEQFVLGEITLENNVWNKKSVADYRQCLFTQVKDGKPVFGWEWQWPASDDVLSYPEIIYGWKPWVGQSTTSKLPRRINDITECSATYDIDMKKSGAGNLAFDIWITDKAVPAEKNIAMEMMVWLDYDGQIPDGSFMGVVTISGAEWDFYKGNPPHAVWGSSAFLRHGKNDQGILDIKDFLDFLVKNKYLSGDDYLASIEFGNEICGGEGKTLFKDYRISMKSR